MTCIASQKMQPQIAQTLDAVTAALRLRPTPSSMLLLAVVLFLLLVPFNFWSQIYIDQYQVDFVPQQLHDDDFTAVTTIGIGFLTMFLCFSRQSEFNSFMRWELFHYVLNLLTIFLRFSSPRNSVTESMERRSFLTQHFDSMVTLLPVGIWLIGEALLLPVSLVFTFLLLDTIVVFSSARELLRRLLWRRDTQGVKWTHLLLHQRSTPICFLTMLTYMIDFFGSHSSQWILNHLALLCLLIRSAQIVVLLLPQAHTDRHPWVPFFTIFVNFTFFLDQFYDGACDCGGFKHPNSCKGREICCRLRLVILFSCFLLLFQILWMLPSKPSILYDCLLTSLSLFVVPLCAAFCYFLPWLPWNLHQVFWCIMKYWDTTNLGVLIFSLFIVVETYYGHAPRGSGDTHERVLWLKGVLVIEACTKGVQPFVGSVMQRLHCRVLEIVKQDIARDLGACEVEDWDCGTCSDAAESSFKEDGPVALIIRAMDADGIAYDAAPHHLKHHKLQPCCLNNIPAGCFNDSDAMSPSAPLLISPNPSDIDNSKSSAFIILRSISFDSSRSILTPFRVLRCASSQPALVALDFYAVLCFSRPGHTKALVESVHSQTPLPESRGEFSFGFWALEKLGSGFQEMKHGVKPGQFLCFEGLDLPHGIIAGCRYLVAETAKSSAHCFNVCGTVVRPAAPWTTESLAPGDAPLIVIRRSAVGRIRDAATRSFHWRGANAEVHWPGIRAQLLSSHHGEFCKLFCSKTSRDLDFFSEDGNTRGCEQLFNMMDMCKAFSSGKENNCSEFCSLFDVKHGKRAGLKASLDNIRKAAVGARDSRNNLAHNLLTLSAQDFNSLVSCARQLLQSVRSVLTSISGKHNTKCVEQALADIEDILKRSLNSATLSDPERLVLMQQNRQLHEEREMREQLLEERDRLQDEKNVLKQKLDRKGRKFDSFPPWLKTDILDQLTASNQIRVNGGQGQVFRVKHWLWGQTLAVKIFHDKDAWRRELDNLTFLTHPNIVRMFHVVYETLEDRAQSCPPLGFSMELMARSAADVSNYTHDQLLAVFQQIASALTFAHLQGVIHFDVKPENILLDHSCTVAKLCDFGWAHKLHTASQSAGAASVTPGQHRGTVFYMAPEAFDPEFKSNPQAKLCDIYSFGKTMWKLLHPSLEVVPNKAKPVSATLPPALAPLKQLVEQCTAEDPSLRPQKMSAVLERLQGIQAALQLEIAALQLEFLVKQRTTQTDHLLDAKIEQVKRCAPDHQKSIQLAQNIQSLHPHAIFQTIPDFLRIQGRSGPIHTIFCLDDSGSMFETWPSVKETVRAFLEIRQDLGSPDDLFSCIQFSSDTAVSFQRAQIESALNYASKLTLRGGSTLLSPALQAVSGLVQPGQQVTIVFMTDGESNEPSGNPIAVAQSIMGQGAQISFFGVAFTPQGKSKILQDVVQAFQGILIEAANVMELLAQFQVIAHDPTAYPHLQNLHLQPDAIFQAIPGTMKTVSEKLVQMESTLTSGIEVSGATSVDKLPSLDALIASSAKVDHVSFLLRDSGVRISAAVSLQQPTIADVQAAPNPEVASQKGISDGGLVKESDKATIINRDPNSKFQVLRTAPPPGISASASFTLSVAVLEDQKFNPASYSDFAIRVPGRPEMRVPVLPRPDLRCPESFQLFDPLSMQCITGQVTLINVDHPEQPPVVLRIPGGKIDLSSNFKEGRYKMKIEAEGRDSVTVERVVAFGPRGDRGRDLILNPIMEKFDLSLRSTFSGEKQMRAVLQWRDKPRDLDLHLYSFNRNTLALVTQCYFKNRGQILGLEHGECLVLNRDDTQGYGCETLTLGQDGKGVPSMNRQHAYVWMVHQFSGMINYVFIGDAAAKISGPRDARWWILAVAKFDHKAQEWGFDRVHKFLPTAETGTGSNPNVAAILPYIKQS